MRDNFPDEECRFELTGSDVLEDFWSKNGQWVGNHHNYNFGDLSRNTSHMIRLEQIRVDPDAPEFAKPHPKQESIRAKQYPEGYEKASLDHYPVYGEEIQAWREGMSRAQLAWHQRMLIMVWLVMVEMMMVVDVGVFVMVILSMMVAVTVIALFPRQTFGSIGPSDILETNSAREVAAYPPRILMSMKLAMEDRVCQVNKYI